LIFKSSRATKAKRYGTKYAALATFLYRSTEEQENKNLTTVRLVSTANEKKISDSQACKLFSRKLDRTLLVS